jgi:glutamate-1-semialdehyde 2,1-aminomutase
LPGGLRMDQAKVEALASAESEHFSSARPRSLAATARAARTMPRGVPTSWMDELYDHPPVWVAHGAGSRFWDLDGHEYVDLYIADMSAFCGHAPAPVVRAVSDRIAAGGQFLLPSEDAIVVAEALAQRYGMAKWQFTLSATQANAEVVRAARVLTGREKVVVFDGKYHGHLETTLAVLEDGRVVPEYTGLPAEVSANLRIVPFGDLDAVERALAPGDVALLLTEPAMTNAGFLLPDPGFHDGLRKLTRRHGTLLAIDETHTLVTAYGGLTTEWGLEPDFLTVGKSIAGGVPLGAYGMTDEAAAVLRGPDGGATVSGIAYDEVATGGTLFANALSMAAARAALTEVLTQQAFDSTARLGEMLAAGLRAHFDRAGLGWSVNWYGSHAYYFFSPDPPRDARGSRDTDDPRLRALIRLFLANRGVWESGWWLGPTVSVAHTPPDVQAYLDVFGDFIHALT